MTNIKPYSLYLVLLFLCGCVAQPINLDTEEHISLMQKDISDIGYDDVATQAMKLSLNDALQIGVAKNLDGQVAALEAIAAKGQINLARINAFPALSLSTNYIGRSNKGAASSQSVITGTQSLEPSFSTEQYRDTQDISANISTLNIMLAVSQTQKAQSQSSISEERYAKTIQNIEKDIYAAYYRALIAQKIEQETKVIFAQANQHLRNLKKAESKGLLSKATIRSKERDIQEKLTSLHNLQNQNALALIELKSLISVPQQTKIILTEKAVLPAKDIQNLMKLDVAALEAEAVKNRPEVREQVLQRNIDVQNIREELIRTIPGGEIFFAFNRDSNGFLRNSQWWNFTTSLEQNLSALLSYNVRRDNAENQKKIEDARRKSLILAVITQVHLARQRLDYLNEIYQDRRDEYKNADYLAYAAGKKSAAGFGDVQSAFSEKIEAEIKKINYYQSLTDVHDAYATLNNTLGRGLLIKD